MYILSYLFFFILVKHLISNNGLNLRVQGVGEEMRELDVRVRSVSVAQEEMGVSLSGVSENVKEVDVRVRGVSKELRETDVCVGSMCDRLKEMEGRVVVVESRNGVAEECEELMRISGKAGGHGEARE